jgi:nitric-oxide synthase
VTDQAIDFLRQFHQESEGFDLGRRLIQVEREIAETGTYRHTVEELAFGARVAWRNQPRCIVRLMWKSLHVFDCRDRDDVFDACCEHLRWSTNGGAIRPAITIFRPGLRISNAQLLGYADDPINNGLLQQALELGWAPQRLLPLVIGDRCWNWPPDAVLEVDLAHPEYPWFAELGLQWYALPAISNMNLEVGGVVYTAAPFSGYYMVTEVGSRDLADPFRYNLLPVVAERLGLDCADRTSLWKDRALHELNRAVLWSYARAGVTMVDHHTAAAQFMHFSRLEREAGREPSAEWMWIVPPTGAATTPVFHTPMKNRKLTPAFRNR